MGDVFPVVNGVAGFSVSSHDVNGQADMNEALHGAEKENGFDALLFPVQGSGGFDPQYGDDGFYIPDVPEKPVKGNWLDAFQRENMDDYQSEIGHITAVNADDTGLYRLFRNLSP